MPSVGRLVCPSMRFCGVAGRHGEGDASSHGDVGNGSNLDTGLSSWGDVFLYMGFELATCPTILDKHSTWLAD